MRVTRSLLAVVSLTAMLACEQATAPVEQAPPPIASFDPSGNRIAGSAVGAGEALLGTLELKFVIAAHLRSDGSAFGLARHFIRDPDFIYDFVTEVTCMAVDPVLGRAWIGGTIKHNGTTDPAFQQAIHQPGRDIWFRVADNGTGQDANDRITFVGFEGGGGIITSEQYCEQRIWPNDANGVVKGAILVK